MSAEIEPKLNNESQLAPTLNWYSTNYTYAEAKMWFEAYLIKRGLSVPKNGFCVGNVGYLCRMIDKGFTDSQTIQQKINERYEEWKNYIPPKRSAVEKVDTTTIPKVVVKPLYSDVVLEDLTNFDSALDANYWAEDKTISNFQKFHFSPKLGLGDGKQIEQRIKEAKKELESVSTLEKEYRDCYPSTAHIKRLLSWLNAILETRRALVVSNIKPKKDVPPVKQVCEMKYLKEILGIKGLHPEKVIGCNAVLLYNTKYRRIMYYESRTSFFAKGMTFFEIHNHFCRTLRKPETQLKELMELSKPQCRAYINNLSGVNGIINDRMNENVIILRTWK